MIEGLVSTRAGVIPKFHRLRFGYGQGCASLAQNEAVETFAAGLEAQFNRLESNRGMENRLKALWEKAVRELLESE